MATVLYEPAFIVLAKHFTAAPERRRAMTALTLVAALASFIFLPVSQALIDAYGWRDALLVLAVILAAITVPLHALVLRPAPAPRAVASDAEASVGAGDALRSRAVLVALGRVLDRDVERRRDDRVRDPVPARARPLGELSPRSPSGWSALSQIPGRLLFAPLAAWLPRPARHRERVPAGSRPGSRCSSASTRPARRSPGSCCWAWATA